MATNRCAIAQVQPGKALKLLLNCRFERAFGNGRKTINPTGNSSIRCYTEGWTGARPSDDFVS